MRILFLSAVLPYPLYSGGQIRIYNLLQRLSAHHEIWLYSFIRKENEKKYLPELSFCHHVETVTRGHAWQMKYMVRGLVGKYPLLLTTYDNEEMKQKILEVTRSHQFDLIHIEPGYVWPSLPEIHVPLVVAEHNVEHSIYEGYRKSAAFFLSPFMKRDINRLVEYEKEIWKKATRTVVVSDSDAAEIASLGAAVVDVVPNGVNEEHFTYTPKKHILSNFRCLFVGNFRWMQNRDALKFLLQNIWPLIHEQYPKATLSVVGQDFPSAFEKYLSSSVLRDEGVEDIAVAFHETDILLAPIRIGGGTKYKILEAMACGLPIVTTDKGIEGLVSSQEQVVMLASEPSTWNESVTKIVTDTVFRMGMVKRARSFIEKGYTWSTISRRLDTVWKNAYEQTKR